MMVNNFTVAYMLMTALSLALCIPAAYVGSGVAGRWRADGMTSEEYAGLEKRIYLVIALICLGFSIRLFIIPLWFVTLQSLVPSVPGAMCMAGLHQSGAPFSYWATALKLLIPLAYLYWLVLNAVDRRIEAQPFMRKKLLLVMPLAFLMVAETFLDANFLYSIKPKVVSCCTSMFDIPRAGALKLIRKEAVTWTVLFYGSIGFAIASYAVRRVFVRTAKAVSAVSSALALVFLILMLHTKVSPVILEAPYHQCIFCLWQGSSDIAVASGSIIAGLWLTLVCALIPDLKIYPAARAYLERIKPAALLLYSSGVIWITARYAAR
jgi:hypothetical protein